MRKLTCILTALFPVFTLATGATATGASGMADQNIVFSCKTASGETVMVKKVGKEYEYTQGNLTFKNVINRVFANEHSEIAVGSGFITYSLELRNQGKSYVVGFIQARGSDSIDEPGVSIYKGATLEKTIACDRSTVYHNFDTKNMRGSGL